MGPTGTTAMIRAGHCTACGDKVWRTAVAQVDKDGQKAGDVVLLWPDPTSLYAWIETPDGHAPGVAFCAECVDQDVLPDPDYGYKVLKFDTAGDRYRHWFTEGYGVFLRAWLADHLKLDDVDIVNLSTQWNRDRSQVLLARQEEIAAGVGEPDDGRHAHQR